MEEGQGCRVVIEEKHFQWLFICFDFTENIIFSVIALNVLSETRDEIWGPENLNM